MRTIEKRKTLEKDKKIIMDLVIIKDEFDVDKYRVDFYWDYRMDDYQKVKNVEFGTYKDAASFFEAVFLLQDGCMGFCTEYR